ncbi:YIP1 family protein [Pseudoalteromonas sp. 68 DY56-GL68]|uniref:YIP1 family protein n=1 Tax=Pseudoalteromonas sp. 68 DY56-GL68 TaxID=2974919 RepID=UPI00352AD44B
MKSLNVITALMNIFISPSKVFNGLKETKGWSWLAFLLMVILISACTFTYYNTVDKQFLIDEQVAIASIDATIGEQKMIRQYVEQNIDNQVWLTLISGLIAIAILNAVIALYYLFISKQDPDANYSYGAWYGFGIWCMMPVVISNIGTLALILTASSPEISQTAVFSYASINQLLLGLELGQPFYTMMENINIFTFWGIALATIGLTCWTNFSFNKALIFAALPSLVIYGIWTVVVLI